MQMCSIYQSKNPDNDYEIVDMDDGEHEDVNSDSWLYFK